MELHMTLVTADKKYDILVIKNTNLAFSFTVTNIKSYVDDILCAYKPQTYLQIQYDELLGCDTIQCAESVPLFHKKQPPPSSESLLH